MMEVKTMFCEMRTKDPSEPSHQWNWVLSRSMRVLSRSMRVLRRSVRVLIFLSVQITSYDVAADWIDPETPQSVQTIRSHVVEEDGRTPLIYRKFNSSEYAVDRFRASRYGKVYNLVMSDEFNVPGRTFDNGRDPKWTALNKNDYTNDALHYYTPDNIITNEDGDLEITTEAKDIQFIGMDDETLKPKADVKHFASGMLQSWNKFCFTGGIVEAEVQMPGLHNVGGLWPAFWLLGNMARHTYVGSSANIWPFAATECNVQSREAQLISGCDNVEHFGLQKHLGRGAPEIDIFEVQAGSMKANTGKYLRSYVGQPFMSASYQLAPGRSARPGDGWWPSPGQWYEGMQYGNETCLNLRFYGTYNHFAKSVIPAQDYWSDAISYNRQLHSRHFKEKHVYRLEWGLPTYGTNRSGFDSGYLNWFLDGELVLSMNGSSIEDAGLGTEISSEPMSIIMNTAVSKQWGFPDKPGNCPGKVYNCNSMKWEEKCGFAVGFCDMMKYKPSMKVNYVRVYQDRSNDAEKVGCSTPERPTRKFIEGHENLYMGKGDNHALKPIQRGRGACDPEVDSLSSLSKIKISIGACGGKERGYCASSKMCECHRGWTGPHCLVPDGHNDKTWDAPDSIMDLGFHAPRIRFSFLSTGLVVLAVMMLFTVVVGGRHIEKYRSSRRRRKRGWVPIFDFEKF